MHPQTIHNDQRDAREQKAQTHADMAATIHGDLVDLRQEEEAFSTEVLLLTTRPQTRALSQGELERITRLLLIARTSIERRLIGYHLMHHLNIDIAGERVGLPFARAVAVFNALLRRLREVERAQSAQRTDALGRRDRPDVPTPEDRTRRFT